MGGRGGREEKITVWEDRREKLEEGKERLQIRESEKEGKNDDKEGRRGDKVRRKKKGKNMEETEGGNV